MMGNVGADDGQPPPVMVKLLLIALVSPLDVAVSVNVPAASRLQPAKVATPATALMGFALHVRVGPPGGVMVSVTEALLVTTVLPLASWTVTTGWVPKAAPTLEFEGFLVKASFVAVAVMVKLALTALVSPLEVAVRV